MLPQVEEKVKVALEAEVTAEEEDPKVFPFPLSWP
jgi:hypothetical protein